MNILFLASYWHYGSRFLVVVVALAVWFWTQSLIGAKAACCDGVGDALHRLTARWHGFLLARPKAADALLIVSSFFIDLFGLSLIGLSVFGPSMGPFVAVILLFVMRQICQAICTLPPPSGMIWRHPGFPSLLVTYGVSNDLFFSGHTALAVLGAIEISHLAPPWLAVLVCVVAFLEAAVVLVLRAHYTLDIIAGALAAWFASDIAHGLTPVIDRWLAS
jgi:hypothetical protein